MSDSRRLLPRREGRGFLRSGLWFIPIMSLVGASLLALVTTALDRRIAARGLFAELFTRNPEAIRSALSVVASSILTFTALVFSVTMLVVQQASNQLSPRVVQRFLDDRMSQVTLGTFLGTFAYTLLVLRDIRSPTEGISFVPGISVALVFVAVLASLTVFVAYLNHVTESVQVGTVVDRIASSTRAAVARLYDGEPPFVERRRIAEHSGRIVRWNGDGGAVRGVDVDELERLAVAAGATISVRRRIGSHVRRDQPIFVVDEHADVDVDALRACIVVGPRTIETDVAFGLRQLVDIAQRALSPGVNDPTTAVQVLDRIGDVLSDLSRRPLFRSSDGGALIEGPDWDEFVGSGLRDIRLDASGTAAVLEHLLRTLDELIESAPADVAAPLERQREAVRQTISASTPGGPTDAASIERLDPLEVR